MNEQSMHDALLDRVLRKAIVAPALPAGFRQRLTAAIARNTADDSALRRQLLDQERRARLVELQRDSVRLRLKTLGALIGGAFSAGVGTTLAWPWISATFAPYGDIALVAIGMALGITIGLSSWMQRAGPPPWVP